MLLRLGFTPLGDSPELRADIDGFARLLGEALGDDVLPLLAPDYKSLLTALTNNIAQIGWLPPILAARRVQSGAVLPVAVAVRGGVSAFMSVLFSKRGSAFASCEDLVGARVAWVDRESAAGYLVMRAALAGAGIDLVQAFREESFLGSHGAVARAVLDRKVDLGATYLTYSAGTKSVLRAGWREAGDDGDFRIVHVAGPIPADFFGVHKSLAGERINLLQSFLVDGRSAGLSSLATKLFQTDAFVRPDPGHLTALASLLSQIDRVGGT